MQSTLNHSEIIHVYTIINQFKTTDSLNNAIKNKMIDQASTEVISFITDQLQKVPLSELLQFRLCTYNLTPITSTQFLDALLLTQDIEDELTQKIDLPRVVIMLLDLTIYHAAKDDSSHQKINEIREHLFSQEDYILQIEYTIELRSTCHHEDAHDQLQEKLIEDYQNMKKYYEDLDKLYQTLLQTLDK